MQALKNIVINGAMSLALLFGLTVSAAAISDFEKDKVLEKDKALEEELKELEEEMKELEEKGDSLSLARLAEKSYRLADIKNGVRRSRWDTSAPGYDFLALLETSKEEAKERAQRKIKFERTMQEHYSKQPNPKIGMDKSRIKYGTNWGAPDYINTTIDSRGNHEQWVYKGNRYLYFDNDKLTSIQY